MQANRELLGDEQGKFVAEQDAPYPDINLLGYRESIPYLDAEVAHLCLRPKFRSVSVDRWGTALLVGQLVARAASEDLGAKRGSDLHGRWYRALVSTRRRASPKTAKGQAFSEAIGVSRRERQIRA